VVESSSVVEAPSLTAGHGPRTVDAAAADRPGALSSNADGSATTSPVGTAAPLHPPQPTAGTAAPTAAAPAAPVQIPTAQPALGAALARLRHRSDGTSELCIALHPAELGSVGVTATVRDGMLTVTVACADPAAHNAVSAALPTLRQELAAAGFGSVDMSLRDSGSQPDPRSAPHHGTDTGGGTADRSDHADHRPLRPLTTVRSTTDRGLDRWL
jgi:flagellar hook-length control protein FliK